MQYLLILHVDELRQTASDPQILADYGKLIMELKMNGTLLGAQRLKPESTLVTATSGTPQVTDGPFAETREQIGGYFLIDVPDRDTAVQVAMRIPAARHGKVEIREVGFTA